MDHPLVTPETHNHSVNTACGNVSTLDQPWITPLARKKNYDCPATLYPAKPKVATNLPADCLNPCNPCNRWSKPASVTPCHTLSHPVMALSHLKIAKSPVNSALSHRHTSKHPPARNKYSACPHALPLSTVNFRKLTRSPSVTLSRFKA